MPEKTGIFVVATTMFLFDYRIFMENEKRIQPKAMWTLFFILSDKKIVYFYIFNTKQQKNTMLFSFAQLFYFTCYKITRKNIIFNLINKCYNLQTLPKSAIL